MLYPRNHLTVGSGAGGVGALLLPLVLIGQVTSNNNVQAKVALYMCWRI
jgi:hypothetical protein